MLFFFFSSRRRHTRCYRDWSSDVCSSDLHERAEANVSEKRVENVIIVGGACAGYTAAVYTSRAELEPLVIEGFQWGGQLQNTTDVENFANDLTTVHRRDDFRASKIMLERAREVPNITFKTPFVPEEFVAGEDGKLAKVRLRHAETGEAEELEVGGAFVAIGHTPRSELVADQVETDEQGYVLTRDGSTRTSLAGVFAVGDLVDHTYRQAVTAAGTGSMGALDAEWYLRDTPPSPEAHWVSRKETEEPGAAKVGA